MNYKSLIYKKNLYNIFIMNNYTTFFFYNKLMNIYNLKKISDDFDIIDGYCYIQSYDKENNNLIINKENNNLKLYGKIVSFNSKLNNIIEKIKLINDIKYLNKEKYFVEQINTFDIYNKTIKAYIIY